MKGKNIKPNVVALSLGATTAIIYLICLILVAIIPLNTMETFASRMYHGMDFSGMMSKNITVYSALTGLISWFLIAYLAGYIFAIIYNFMAERF